MRASASALRAARSGAPGRAAARRARPRPRAGRRRSRRRREVRRPCALRRALPRGPRRPFKKPRAVEEDEGSSTGTWSRSWATSGSTGSTSRRRNALRAGAEGHADDGQPMPRPPLALLHDGRRVGRRPEGTNPARRTCRAFARRRASGSCPPRSSAAWAPPSPSSRQRVTCRASRCRRSGCSSSRARARLRSSRCDGRWWTSKRGLLNLPDSKTGQKVIHLNPPGLSSSSELPRLDGDARVFPPYKRKACRGRPRERVAPRSPAGEARRRPALRRGSARFASIAVERRRLALPHRRSARPQEDFDDAALRALEREPAPRGQRRRWEAARRCDGARHRDPSTEAAGLRSAGRDGTGEPPGDLAAACKPAGLDSGPSHWSPRPGKSTPPRRG